MKRREKTAFGEFLVDEIRQTGMSQDSATGTDIDRRRKFYDLAAQGRNEIPADIARLIADHPLELDNIREILTKMLAVQG